MSTLTYDTFLSYVRSAIHYLYDPDHLRRSPLAGLLGVANRADTPSALQPILAEVIQSFEPGQSEPSDSRMWRIHDALFYLYVRRLDRNLVAEQLGVSERQLRREQRAALEVLAERLWKKYVPNHAEAPGVARPNQKQPAESVLQESTDLAWLKNTPHDKPIDLHQHLSVVLGLTHGLALQHNVRVSIEVPNDLPNAPVNPMAFREILINLLCVAFPKLTGGEIHICARLVEEKIEISLRTIKRIRQTAVPIENESHNLNMAVELAQLCGGFLRVDAGTMSFEAVLVLPALGRVPVLVIDDNPDSHQLFKRYASGTPYQVASISDPHQAVQQVIKLKPRIIVLDVLMPDMDGWDVLAQLRQDPTISRVPIVMCSILPQEALIRSLGANAFLRKPVSRSDFLVTLDRLTDGSLPS